VTQVLDPPARPATNDNGGGQQLAKQQRPFEPLAPIGTAGGLKALLESQRNGIAQALPRHVTPERLIKTFLVAANRIPDLLQCTQASILETINRAAELGLDLSGTLGEAYPVPFNNKMKRPDGSEFWAKQCQLIIGYRGLAKLARQSGEIKRIDADVVCENDEFTFRKGSDARCEFVPNLKGDRGKPVGAYAYVQFKDGGEQFDFMPFGDIEKVRARSKSGSDKQGNAIGAWKSDWPEMAKKTIFRRVAKWLPLSTEKFVRALEQDDADYELADVLEASTGPAQHRGTAGLVNKLKARETTARVLPDTQLPEDEAAARIQQQAADTGASDDPDVGDSDEPPPTEDLPDRVKAGDARSRRVVDQLNAQSDPQIDIVEEALKPADFQGRRKMVFDLVKREHPELRVTSKDFDGWLFRYGQAHQLDTGEMGYDAWRKLYDAIAEGRFDSKTGAVRE
jgi:recombination protein RecT